MLHYHQTKNILTDARQQMKKPCWNWIYNSILCSKFRNWGQGQINEQIQEFIVNTILEMNTMEYTQWKKCVKSLKEVRMVEWWKVIPGRGEKRRLYKIFAIDAKQWSRFDRSIVS